MTILKYTNLALRFLLELCALGAVGYWGFHAGKGTIMKVGLGIGVPILIAVIWGTLGSPNASVKLTPPLHILLELIVFGLPAVALYVTGKPQLAWVYGIAVIINHADVYMETMMWKKSKFILFMLSTFNIYRK